MSGRTGVKWTGIALIAALGLLYPARASDPDARIVPDRGVLPGRGYQISDIESINMATGGLTLRLPLGQLPSGPAGTGGAVLTYNSKYWHDMPVLQSTWYHQLEGDNGGGWWLRFGYVLEAVYPEWFSINDPCSPGPKGWLQLRLIEPDGSEHTFFRKGAPLLAAGCDPANHRVDDLDVAQRQIWYTLDGSYLRLEIEGGSELYWPNNPWTLFRPDGSKVALTYVDSKQVVTYTDRNGNKLTWKSDSVDDCGTARPADKLEDEFGHSIVVVHFADGHDEVWQQGNGNMLRSSIYYTNPSFTGLIYKSNPQGQLYYSPFGNVPQVVDSVTTARPYNTSCQLVTGNYAQPFQFTYAARYRELSRMEMPSGATVDYTWKLDGDLAIPTDQTTAKWYYDILLNSVLQKTVTYRTGTGNATPKTDTTMFNFPDNSLGGRLTSSSTAPDGGVTSYAFYPLNYRDGGATNGYAGTIKTVTRPDGSTSGKIWVNNPQFGVPGAAFTRSNHYVSWEYETSTGSTTLQKTRKFQIDRNGNQLSMEERDWSSWTGSAPTTAEVGGLLRRTETPMWSLVATSAADPEAPAPPSAAEPNGYIELTSARVLSLPTSRTVKDGAGTVAEEVKYTYDSVATGNVNPESVHDVSPGVDAWRDKTFTYDRGRLATVTDADSIAATYTYGNCNGFALSGKSIGGLTTSYSVDCSTGLLSSMTNPQSRIDSFSYDVWGRLLSRSEGGLQKTSYGYDDQALWVVERRDVSAFNDQSAVTVYYEDQLGRERRRRMLESPISGDASAANESNSAVIVDTAYEITLSPSKNAVKVSNPYKTTQTGDALGWTVSLKDQLGRSCAVEYYAGMAEPSATGTCSTPGASRGGRTTIEYGAVWDSIIG